MNQQPGGYMTLQLQPTQFYFSHSMPAASLLAFPHLFPFQSFLHIFLISDISLIQSRLPEILLNKSSCKCPLQQKLYVLEHSLESTNGRKINSSVYDHRSDQTWPTVKFSTETFLCTDIHVEDLQKDIPKADVYINIPIADIPTEDFSIEDIIFAQISLCFLSGC